MNILVICNKSPWPPKEGGPIAMNAMVEGLLDAGHKVKVLAINSNKYAVDIASIPEDYRRRTEIELVFIDLSIKIADAFRNLFSSESYHVKRFISNNFEIALRRILENDRYEIVQLETLFVTPYIPVIRELSEAKVILRAHNIEHLIWERLMTNEKNPIKKWYLRHLTVTLKEFETGVLKDLDGIVPITEKDAQFFRKKTSSEKIIAIPFGIKPLPDMTLDENAKSGITISSGERAIGESSTIFHLGSMNWLPNLEGIKWFLEKVWPILLQKRSDIIFRIAGREMPEWIKNTGLSNVIVDGEVPDAYKYMQDNRIMVVPLFSGSGIRIKIIEGMMAGCAIITTTLGAEGINYENKKHLIIADNSLEFIQSIIELVDNPQKVNYLGNNAREFIQKSHNNNILIKKLESFYESVLS